MQIALNDKYMTSMIEVNIIHFNYKWKIILWIQIVDLLLTRWRNQQIEPRISCYGR